MAVFGSCLGFALACIGWLVYETYDCKRVGLGLFNDGLGRVHTKAATGHGCITFLLLRPLQKGRITSRRGDCWDNAMAESFFSSLKKERIRKSIYKTRDIARADIFDYIEVFYNRTRRRSHLGGVSPEALNASQFEVRVCLP